MQAAAAAATAAVAAAAAEAATAAAATTAAVTAAAAAAAAATTAEFIQGLSCSAFIADSHSFNQIGLSLLVAEILPTVQNNRDFPDFSPFFFCFCFFFLGGGEQQVQFFR